METTIKSDFDSHELIATVYKGKFAVCSFDFKSNEFEAHDEITEFEKELYIELMESDFKYYENNKDYDVMDEQGLYGYGY